MLCRCSIAGVILPSLTTALCQRSHIREISFVTDLLPMYITLFEALDAFNKIQPAAVATDNRFLRKLPPKRERKVVVEAKYPLYGK